MGKGGLKFLTDEDLSPALAQILRRLGVTGIDSICGKPEQGRPDEEWIPVWTERGFVIITADRSQLGEDAVAAALSGSRARVIYLPRKFVAAGRWDGVIWFLKMWPKIVRAAEYMKPGQLLVFHWNGTCRDVKIGMRSRAKRVGRRDHGRRQPPDQGILPGTRSR